MRDVKNSQGSNSLNQLNESNQYFQQEKMKEVHDFLLVKRREIEDRTKGILIVSNKGGGDYDVFIAATESHPIHTKTGQ